MAVKKSTANQREDRVSTPNIPAVIAKPAPNPAQTLNLYGSPSTNARPVVASKPSTFTYGLGNPLETRVTQPGQTLPTTVAPKPSGDSRNTGSVGGGTPGGTPGGAPGGGPGGTPGGDITPETETKPEDIFKEDPSLAYAKAQDEKNKRNAFALLKNVFTQYGLGELSSVIETLMKEGYEPEEATLALKTDPRYNKAYITRFRGNELRRSAGLNVLTEAEYLTLEDDYTKTLKSYGLESYFGVEKSIKQSAIADVIGADISAIEFTERVSTAVDRVKMADPATKSAFQQFYGIGEADLVKYFLDPKKALVNLKEKAVSAEIGGAALGQGLTAMATSAEDLARFGINREQAQAGYSTIAQELPTAAKLGQIYSEEGITYGQTEAEQATFKGLASARRKKERLIEKETASFQGSSGVGAAGLSTTYLRRGSAAGQF